MKGLKKISLSSLAQTELKERQAKELRGGYDLPTVCVTNCKCEYISTNEPSDPLHGLTNTFNNKVDQSKQVTDL